MKLLHKRFTYNNIFLIIIIGIALFMLASCAQKVGFVNSSVVPAAKGTVKISTDKNKNNVIEIHIVDLADVNRLRPAKESYVAWMETDRGENVNLGQLNSSTNFLSKQMKASIETVSSYNPVKIYITAENNINTKNPDNLIIMTTEEFN